MEIMNTGVGSIPVEQMMTMASLALLVYDYFLTLGSEIERFWKRGFHNGLNWGSFLFFAIRYLALLGYIPITLELFKQTDVDTTRWACRFILGVYTRVWTFSLQIIIACVMLMRICALYKCRVRALAFPVIIAIYCITIGIVGVFKSPSKEIPTIKFHCNSGLTADQAHYIAGAYGGELAFEIAIFAMTLYKALTLPRGSGFGILTMIMRDGAMYFGAMTTLHFANILVLILADPVNRGAMGNPTLTISSVIVTRLMLNLRDPRLIGGAEDFKTTTLNVHGFNVQRRSGIAGGDSENVCGDESSV